MNPDQLRLNERSRVRGPAAERDRLNQRDEAIHTLRPSLFNEEGRRNDGQRKPGISAVESASVSGAGSNGGVVTRIVLSWVLQVHKAGNWQLTLKYTPVRNATGLGEAGV